MADFLARMRTLAGLLREAAPYLMSPDEAAAQDDADDDARQARETRIIGLIAQAFRRLGIAIADPDFAPISYTEDDRTATVQLDDSEISVARLARLQKSGLSTDYVVQVGADHALDIVFIVSPELDHAEA